MGRSARPGTSCRAWDRTCMIPAGVTFESKLPASTVAPMTIRPSAFGTMYESPPKRTRRRIGGRSPGIRSDRDCPLWGSSGTGSRFLIHAPFATRTDLADTYRALSAPSHNPLQTPSCRSSEVTSFREPQRNSTPAPTQAAFREQVRRRASTLASSGNHHPPTTSGCRWGSSSRAWVASNQKAVGGFFFFFLPSPVAVPSLSSSSGGAHVATLSPAKAGAKKPPEATYPMFHGSRLLSSFIRYACPSGPDSCAIPSTSATKSTYMRFEAKHRSR
mmetsp:Transcript_8218/g.17092  ORF Transcript_8218/g.17092 Transcript_8218/m.17092 type:complete len:274 (-) Transcript_8218:212-1033(-)